MSQSTAILAFLGLAFLVFVTQRGELRLYMGFLIGTVQPAAQAPAQAQASQNGVTLNDAAKYAEVAAAFL